jgi:RNA-directed DNA polymerase
MEDRGTSRMKDRKAPRKRQKETDPMSEAWKQLPWKQFEQYCFRIQKRIYRASQQGKSRTVQKLQKLLMKSKAARFLAVRRVTQDNQGKKTAGIDGVKSVHPNQRFELVESLHPKNWKDTKATPVRRVWIPKPGKDEKRPLGIPTMQERAKQALVKMGLEPEWEAKFEPNSYGFRPGRSCHDAIEMIHLVIKGKSKYVLDADIKGCFDNINQPALLEKLQTYPALKQTIKHWLEAGVLDNGVFSSTDKGTPQGGVISPLLANIALHGMEETIKEGYGKSPAVERPALIRYADDFVILHSKKKAVEKAAQRIEQWLADMGLHLNPKKTRITHTLEEVEGNVGFDFLGFTVRQYPTGKSHSAKNSKGKILGFKTEIRPSKEGIKRHTAEVNKRMRRLRPATQYQVIQNLNPIIFGWTNYYKTVVSSVAFKKCDRTLYQQLAVWAEKKHPKRGKKWIAKQY